MKLSRRQALCASASFAAACATPPLRESSYPEHLDPGHRKHSRFWRPHDRELVEQLRIEPNAHVLDVGCGAGDHALMFADRAPHGSATALDISTRAISELQARIARSRFEGRVEPQVGDIHELPFSAGSFDAAWCSHLLHLLPDPTAGVRELTRVVRSGGRVAVREDRLLLRCLPLDVGLTDAGLEERVNAAIAAWFAAERSSRGRVTAGWLGVLRSGGLHDVDARSVLFEFTSPLDPLRKSYIRDRIVRHASDPRVSGADREALRELSTEGGPYDALARDDLHFVSVSSLYIGRV